MNFNCLGSICSKISESCSFNMCNSNRNVLLIGNTNNANLNSMISGNQGLSQIVNQVGGQIGGQLELGIQLTPTRSVRTLAGSDIGFDMAVRTAIVETSVRETFKLMQAGESFEAGWKKFLLAQADCGIDLENLCKEAEPLRQTDVSKLDKAVDKVAKYHLSAIYLWKIFCQNSFDAENIRRNSQISYAQIMFVKKQLRKKHKYRDINNFWNLNVDVQKIFLDGSVKYFKPPIHEHCRVARTLAFDVVVLEAQKSNDHYLRDQAIQKAYQTPQGRMRQMEEHKGDEQVQKAVNSYLANSPLAMTRAVLASNQESSQHRSSQTQAQIQGASVTLRRSSLGGSSPDESVRGDNSAEREDSSFIPKVPISSNTANA